MKKCLASALFFLLVLFGGQAWAVKPQPPISVKCVTISSQNNIFKAECTVSVNGDMRPVKVELPPMQDSGTFIASYAPPPGGVGKWEIVFEMHGKGPCTVLFNAFYENNVMMRAAAVYDPYGVLAAKEKETLTGVIKEKKDGGKVKEYPSN